MLAALGARLPATGLARTVAARLICAAGLSDACAVEPELVAAYGAELAGQVAKNAPRIIYERGMTALPVDFRSCRGGRCGNGPDSGAVGAPTQASPRRPSCTSWTAVTTRHWPRPPRAGSTVRATRAGHLYIQYWLYYEDSTSLRDLPGGVGSHEDDWEGYQIRIGPDGAEARATSHHGYNYRGGPGSWLSDAGIVHRSAWGRSLGHLYVSGGSHAGHVDEDGQPSSPRWTPADRLELIPIETLGPSARRTRFAITPPWRKPVYRDPEDAGT